MHLVPEGAAASPWAESCTPNVGNSKLDVSHAGDNLQGN